MELHLRGFKCYTKTDIRFKSGVTLLNGDSGSGKSTILEAFDYVLYGKLRGQYAHGAKTCSVKLILGPNVWVQRNSGPGKLELNVNGNKYDGDEAQKILDQMYGSREVFLASSYLKQGERSPLMTGTNAEKMALIRAISFHEDNVEEAQEKLKASLKKVQAEIKEAEGALSLANRILQNFDKENPSVTKSQLDLSAVNLDDIEKQIAVETTKLAERTAELHVLLQLEAKIATLRSVKDDASDVQPEELRVKIAEIDAESSRLQIQVDELQQAAAKQAALRDLQASRLKQNALFESLKAEIASLESSIRLGPNETYDSELERISKNITVQSKIKSLLTSSGVSKVGDLREGSADAASKVRSLRATLVELENDLVSKKSNDELSRVLTCPKCTTPLHLESGCLKITGEVKIELKILKHQDVSVAMVEAKRREITQLEDRRDKLKQALLDFNSLYKEFVRETDGDQSTIDAIRKLRTLRTRLNDLGEVSPEIQIETSPELVTEGPTVATLRSQLSALQASKSKHQNDIESYAKNVKLRDELNDLEKQLSDRTSSLLKVDIETLTAEIAEFKSLRELCIKTIRRAELEAIQIAKKEVVEKLEARASGLAKLVELSKQVELRVLNSSVARLNLEMKVFLDIMFPDTPITVEFSTTRDSKSKADSKTMTCSLMIYFRNVEYSNPKDLSGGESDRVSLAMTLALNAMLGSNMLLLDETLNTLDRELKANIVELLKRVTGELKTCIVISHEGVEGVFHNTITL